MQPFRARKRISSIGGVWAAMLIALLWAAPAWAAQGDARATLLLGTANFSIGSGSTTGTSFGFHWGYELEDRLTWSLGATFTSTSGQISQGGQTYDISANTNTLSTGLTYGFDLGPNSIVLPFAGGGLNYVSYDIDFNYPTSEVGRVSGASPGVFGLAGLEFRVSRNFDMFVQYVLSASSIEAQDGSTVTLLAGGLLLSFRLTI
ncbi:MAG: porin family protein [Candidatus Lambdaproteobacteria bacterium]|nr:porin family protein [Candidatus Lambdaproteobacteria bacterium]